MGGYHEGRDMLLIMDTARFKYPPHWVPVPLLFAAMRDHTDPITARCRGFFRVTKLVRYLPRWEWSRLCSDVQRRHTEAGGGQTAIVYSSCPTPVLHSRAARRCRSGAADVHKHHGGHGKKRHFSTRLPATRVRGPAAQFVHTDPSLVAARQASDDCGSRARCWVPVILGQ